MKEKMLIGVATVVGLILALVAASIFSPPGLAQIDLGSVADGKMSAQEHWPGLKPDVTIDMELFTSKFAPTQISVKKGQVVRLRLKGMDNGIADAIGGDFDGHGLYIEAPYDIWLTGITKGKVKEVVFRAEHSGEIPFSCAVICGLEHWQMRGKLIVKEG
jgi:hypothetical protein